MARLSAVSIQYSPNMKEKDKSSPVLTRVSLFVVMIPLSLVLWLFLRYWFRGESPSPVRCLCSILIPLTIAKKAKSNKHVESSGAIALVFIGFVVTMANYCFLACLYSFLFSLTKLSQLRSVTRGVKVNSTWEACSPGIVVFLFSQLYLLEKGTNGESTVNFLQDYNASWFAMCVLGALSCCSSVTAASVIGYSYSRSNTAYLITSLKPVAKGTPGAVSLVGTMASFAAGFITGFVYYISILLWVPNDILASSPLQMPVILVGAFSGLLGSLLNSFLAANLSNITTQTIETDAKYLMVDDLDTIMTRRPTRYSPTQFISSIEDENTFQDPSDKVPTVTLKLTSSSVNILSALLTALLSPKIALYTWSYYEPLSVPFS